jgi:hypothetical protein
MWEFNIERRAAPRRSLKLEFRVLLVATGASLEGDEQTFPLIGYTRDISESGVALLVSARSLNALYSLGQNYVLQLMLTLPTGPVELEASPVRYQHINEGASGSLILIGARITKMSVEACQRFVEYLNSVE